MKYIDEYGDIWVLIAKDKIKRLRDGNIGGLFNEQGLKRITR